MANRIREVRLAHGLTQQQLAAQLGMSHTYLGKLERDRRRVSLDWLEQIARALGCRVADLIEDGVEVPPAQQLEEDAVRYEAGADIGYEQRVLATLYPGHPNAMLYRVRSRVLDQIGYQPGDLVVIDFGAEAVAQLVARDIVLAQTPPNEYGDTASLLRMYIPPLLITQTTEPTLHEALRAGDDAVIVGVARILVRRLDHHGR